jgi:DNA-binding PadR family transcriptional regulator
METRPLSVPVFQTLVSLSDRQLHGYAILRDIKRRTDGQVSLTASTLYSAVNRLLDAGWIRESDERPAPELDDERRRYFAITDAGLQALRQELWRLEWTLGSLREKCISPLPPKNV